VNARLVFTLAVLMASPVLAQTRQPAQITTLPTTSPQEFDLLDSTGKWLPLNTGAGVDVRTAGCVADGVTDQTACINNALANASDCVIIPATQNGFYVAGTITVTKCLRGTTWLPTQTQTPPSNSSRILCNNQAAQPCLVISNPATTPPQGGSTQVENISLIGSGATPVANSVGLKWINGQNSYLTNVSVNNFDTCAYFGPTAAAGIGPLRLHSVGSNFFQCQKHYVVQDGIPELAFVGGVWGNNGGVDYASADDFYYGTKTAVGGGGGGPNTFVLDGVQINPGGKSIGCAFRWGGFTNPSGAGGANKIIGSHVEVLGNAYTGSASRGFICTDSSVTVFPEIKVIGSELMDDSTPKLMPLFNIDPATNWGNGSFISLIGNEIQAAAFNLTIHNVLFSFAPSFIGNWIYQPATFTAGDTSAVANISGNTFFSGYTVAGQWAGLYLNNNLGTKTDTATGVVFAGGDTAKTFTPSLTFGGASVGMTYGTQTGSYQRTADGGYQASINIILTAKGSSAGTARLEGMPFTCGSMTSTSLLNGYSNLAALTGPPMLQLGGGNTFVFILQPNAGGTGSVSTTDANFTNTSVVQATVRCGKTT
jgi:hypothetical protein